MLTTLTLYISNLLAGFTSQYVKGSCVEMLSITKGQYMNHVSKIFAFTTGSFLYIHRLLARGGGLRVARPAVLYKHAVVCV